MTRSTSQLRTGALPDSSLIATRLGSVRRVVCASRDYLAANGTPTTPDDLAQPQRDLVRERVFAQFLDLRIRRRRNDRVVSLALERQHHRCGNRRRPIWRRPRPGAVLPGRRLRAQRPDDDRPRTLSSLRRCPCISYTTRQSRLPLKLRAFVDLRDPWSCASGWRTPHSRLLKLTVVPEIWTGRYGPSDDGR